MYKSKNRGAVWGLLAVAVAIALLGSAVATGPALAGKGGNGNGNGHGNQSATTVGFNLTPNPVVAYGEYTVSGSGFSRNTSITIMISEPGTTWVRSLTSDAGGSFSFTRTTGSAGSVEHTAYEIAPNGSWHLAATATLTVQ